MIYDVFTYNGEKDLLDLRYNILKDYVDEFILVEFDKTFSGKDKPFYAREIEGKYPNLKIVETYTDKAMSLYGDLAASSPNTQGADHWKREFCQKESIKLAVDAKDFDIVFIGDVDEIWNTSLALRIPIKTVKLGLRVYSYYLNNRSSEEFYGPIMAKWGTIKDKCLNHVRTNPGYFEYVPNAGWHFTSMAGELKRKLTDSYTQESYANDWVMSNLDENVAQNKDFLGRDFEYTLDESEWPQYLKDNRERYKHLCKVV